MPNMTIFDNDRFSYRNLTAAINSAPVVPSRLADMGLFSEKGINTTMVGVERKSGGLELVPAGEYGAPPKVINAPARDMLYFKTVHLSTRSTILASELIGLRPFGVDDGEITADMEVDTVEAEVAERQEAHKDALSATIEFHRIGAIKGLVLDADGQSVLLNVYDKFGFTQRSVAIDFSAAALSLRSQLLQVIDAIDEGLGKYTSRSRRVLAGADIWALLVANKALEDTFKYGPQAAALRGDPTDSIEFGGFVWERYVGKVGTQAFIAPGEAYAFADGVKDLFITRFAPADHVLAAKTKGLPFYTSIEYLDHGKGVDLLSQSNPFNICTRPQSIVKLTIKK